MTAYVGALQRYATDVGGKLPGFMRGPKSSAFLEAVGLTLDVAVASLAHGLQQSRPLTCFPDALPVLGEERGIVRRGTEPIQSYRVRLSRHRQIKRHAGSAYGEMINLQPYFLPGALPMLRIVSQDGDGDTATWHTLTSSGIYSWHRASPSNWAWDTNPLNWSRFWVIIYTSGIGVDTAEYDDGTVYDDGHTVWGGHFTTAQILDMAAIINEARAAHSFLMGFIFVSDPTALDPAGTSTTLGDGSTTYPVGNWYTPASPVTGQPSMPPGVTYAYTGS